jgi:hypothetical protein
MYYTGRAPTVKPSIFSFEDDVCRLLWAVAFSGEYTWNKWEIVTQFVLILTSEIYYKEGFP